MLPIAVAWPNSRKIESASSCSQRAESYYQLWVYSDNTQQWTRSGYKRVQNGIVLEPEVFLPGAGWVLADDGYDGLTAKIYYGPQVGVKVGRGWQYVVVETYWAKPAYAQNLYNPDPGPGWRHLDELGWCQV